MIKGKKHADAASHRMTNKRELADAQSIRQPDHVLCQSLQREVNILFGERASKLVSEREQRAERREPLTALIGGSVGTASTSVKEDTTEPLKRYVGHHLTPHQRAAGVAWPPPNIS